MPNLISPTAWTTGGPGTATAGAALSLTGTGTGTTYARQAVATEPGATYWFTFEVLTSTVVPGRLVGTTAGGGEIVASASAAAWSNRIAFTATAATTWVQLQRQNTGEARVDAVSVEKATSANLPARRFNGVNQYLSLDVQAAGLRTLNHTLYVGGWVRFEMPTSNLRYLADLGRADAAAGGVGRIRLVAGTGTDVKVFASSGLFDGSRYRECATNTTVDVGAWYYAGVRVEASGEVQLIWNGVATGARTGDVPTAQADLCRLLQFGARSGSPVSGYAPVSLSDWIWCSGSLPTTAQVSALASGTRPADVAGLAPTHHWPMAVDGGAETPLAGAASLAASGTPRLSVGPAFGAPEPPAAPAVPLDIIVV